MRIYFFFKQTLHGHLPVFKKVLISHQMMNNNVCTFTYSKVKLDVHNILRISTYDTILIWELFYLYYNRIIAAGTII